MMIAQCASLFCPAPDPDSSRLLCGIPAYVTKFGHTGPVMVLSGSLIIKI